MYSERYQNSQIASLAQARMKLKANQTLFYMTNTEHYEFANEVAKEWKRLKYAEQLPSLLPAQDF
jgi:hypothetical protein